MKLLEPFVTRRMRWGLTWRGWLIVLLGLGSAGVAVTRGLGEFLAVSAPAGARVLVVEGWLPAFAYPFAARLYRERHYDRVIAVGVYAEEGTPDGIAREFAPVGQLASAGVPRAAIELAVGAPVHVDRTYHAALNVARVLGGPGGGRPPSIDVLTIGAHARRSRLLYERAVGDEVRVGVIAVPDPRFEVAHWWRTSEGVRTVIGETIAYAYARLSFEP